MSDTTVLSPCVHQIHCVPLSGLRDTIIYFITQSRKKPKSVTSTDHCGHTSQPEVQRCLQKQTHFHNISHVWRNFCALSLKAGLNMASRHTHKQKFLYILTKRRGEWLTLLLVFWRSRLQISVQRLNELFMGFPSPSWKMQV